MDFLLEELIVIDTIFALSSAVGRAGVAVLRVSGPRSRVVADLMAVRPGRPLDVRRARLTAIRHPVTGALIDRGIAVWFPAPSSFTGEDVVEFQVHGGRAVVDAMLEALGQVSGCRMAEPGEFARRAFAAGKLDLAQAEGLADLIDSETESQRVQALRQAGGGLSELYEDWRARLVRARAGLEAAIDFSDEEDVARASMVGVEDAVVGLHGELVAHLKDGNRGEIVRDGFKIVLAGAPNVGKSSLLNALARRDAAIVSPEAGTTRDVVEVRLDLDGFAVRVSDTAGIREAEGSVEKEGIARTMLNVADADLVLWMVDLSAPSGPPPADVLARKGACLVVLNKRDLVDGVDVEVVQVEWTADARDWFSACGDPAVLCARTPDEVGDLTDRLAGIVRDRIGDSTSPVATRARHRQHLVECLAFLDEFLGGPEVGQEIELQAELLRSASFALGRITGRVDVEDVLDDVFGQFCIGK